MTTSWPVADDLETHLRDIQRRLIRSERRPAGEVFVGGTYVDELETPTATDVKNDVTEQININVEIINQSILDQIAAQQDLVEDMLADQAADIGDDIAELSLGHTFYSPVLVSPLLETHVALERGIKIVSTDHGAYGSLISYAADGTPTFVLNGQTGAVTMKGELQSGSNIQGATITGVLQTNNDGPAHVPPTTPTGIKLTTAGMVFYKPDGTPMMTLMSADGSIAMQGPILSGGTITGTVVKTGTSPAQRVELRDAATSYGGQAEIDFYTGSTAAPGYMRASTIAGVETLAIQAPAAVGYTRPIPSMALRHTASMSEARLITDLFSIFAAVSVSSNMDVDGALNVDGFLTAQSGLGANGISSWSTIDAAGVITGLTVVGTNRVRSMSTLGVWGSLGPSSQPAAIADDANFRTNVIAVLSAYGLTA